jgi:hypothetical protein
MSTFALTHNGVVIEISSAEFPVNAAFTWVDASAASPTPAVGWSYANGSFSAPPTSTPTLPQQALAAMSTGLAIVSTANPGALNGTYAVDNVSTDHIQAEMIALLNSAGASFADGTNTVVWPDMANANHTFSTTEFKAFALAVGAYVAGLYKVMNGTLQSLPAANAAIP